MTPKIVKITSGSSQIYVNPSQLRAITAEKQKNGKYKVSIFAAGNWSKTINDITDYGLDKIRNAVGQNYNTVTFGERCVVKNNRKNLTVTRLYTADRDITVFPRALQSMKINSSRVACFVSPIGEVTVQGDFTNNLASVKEVLPLV